jgi:hypothetical protein
MQILLLIDDEEFRSRKFLNSTSYTKVHNECLQRLVCDHFDTLKSECNELIIKEDLDGIEKIKRNILFVISHLFSPSKYV